jgi:hypothetical protein
MEISSPWNARERWVLLLPGMLSKPKWQGKRGNILLAMPPAER